MWGMTHWHACHDLLTQAAEMGHGPAMNNLALLYLEGTHPNGRDVILVIVSQARMGGSGCGGGWA